MSPFSPKQPLIWLYLLLLLFGTQKLTSTGAIDNDENACCKLGQVQGATAGHCLTLNVTSALSHNDTADLFSCQLTAKMCCLRGQQAKLCRRVAGEMLDTEPVEGILGTALLQNRNRVRIDANSTALSTLLTSQYSCDLKRNTDALCCLGCNLGLLWAVQRLAKLNGEHPIETLTSLDTESWCAPNGTTVHSVGRTVGQSLGFAQCCREALRAIHRSIRWCDLKPAPCAHRCHEAVTDTSRVQCSCYEGYRLGPDGTSCVDSDECAELTDNCDRKYERCHNTEGGFQCLERKTPKEDRFPVANCSEGYYYNISEARCKDIDECRYALHDCTLRTQVCRNLLGSFVCLDIDRKGNCPSGFRLVPGPSQHGAVLNCVDIDECTEGSFDCDRRREDCENFIGSYTCEEKVRRAVVQSSTSATPTTPSESSAAADPTNCAKGFHFVRFSYQCEDINECRIGQHDCDLTREKCINFPGTFSCVSLDGVGTSGESREEGSAAAGSSSALRSSPPTAKLCPSGFERNEELDICEDTDECSGLLSPCSEMSYCQNTIGSYVCHCKTGYIKASNDSNFCNDVNECTTGLHNCFGTLRCINTLGSFECQSPPATSASHTVISSSIPNERSQVFPVSPREVEDTHSGRNLQCEPGERIHAGECQPVDCGIGFFYNVTERRCQDLNECLRYSPCKSTEKCTNTVGSYRCSVRCSTGYRSVSAGTACEDIDECIHGSYHCPTGQLCKNRPGGYSCQCPPGYVGPNPRTGTCEDVDECAASEQNVICEENQRCVNTPGSYRCQCKEGFREEVVTHSGRIRCIDLDECGNSEHRCEQLCLNYAGSYKCGCKTGFRLAADGRHCVDVNECESLVKSGRLLGTGNATTTEQVCYFKCLNTVGSFQCICPPGYESLSEGRICKDIDECEKGDICQGMNEYCLNVRGSYRCNVINCPEGYYLEVNSRKCILHMNEMTPTTLDLTQPLSYSYNYLSIVSNLRIPGNGYLDLLAMSGPVFSVTGIKFDLALKTAKPHRLGVQPAHRDDFILRRPEYNRIIVALTRSIEGPQDVELELTVSLYSEAAFGGSTKAVITIVVSEYEF